MLVQEIPDRLRAESWSNQSDLLTEEAGLNLLAGLQEPAAFLQESVLAARQPKEAGEERMVVPEKWESQRRRKRLVMPELVPQIQRAAPH